MEHKVLIIGGGGREHALALKLSKSPQVQQLFLSPGNAGTARVDKSKNVLIDLENADEVASFCKANTIDLVVIGPEAPLASGLVDHLKAEGIQCFGPSKDASRIESDKSFAKAFMERHGIPTAQWKSFERCDEAISHINDVSYDALVVKVSGLAAGKGVFVAENNEEAIKAVKHILVDKSFGDAGSTIVVEEKLCGEEISVLSFSDGHRLHVFPPAQDYKRLLEGNNGPNTGGMGAYAPVHHVPPELLYIIEKEILSKAIAGMEEEGYPFVGVLYAGIMLTSEGPKVLEFNCRFGDPETQVLMPLLDSDLYLTMLACARGKLSEAVPIFKKNLSVCTVVLASGGYPASYQKGYTISGLEPVKALPNTEVYHAGTGFDKEGNVVTSGGRVLAVTGMGSELATARETAYSAVSQISFQDMTYRKDIARQNLRINRSFSYLSSGVDIDAGIALVEAIKPLAKATAREGSDAELGGFGGLFDLAACKFRDPILVSGADGVGTKLKIAQACNNHSTVGIDLVAMCVNDILASGAEPLFFLDYFACGRLNDSVAKQVITGVAQGCAMACCALLGGETAEMPGMYDEGVYDLAGFAVGAVEREQVLRGNECCTAGDVVLGIASSGLHSNGFSLVRRVVDDLKLCYQDQCPFVKDAKRTLGEELLTPTKIYVKSVLGLIKERLIKGFAHITGGGLTENIPRILPDTLGVELDAKSWDVPPVFSWLHQLADIEETEMLRTFNCGIGAVLVVETRLAQDVMAYLKDKGEEVWCIGKVVNLASQKEQVVIKGFQNALSAVTFDPESMVVVGREAKRLKLTNGDRPRMRVGVLISGTGTNLQALIDRSFRKDSHADIVLVISNVAGVQGLERAERVGIPTKVINHKTFKSRLNFDMAVDTCLRESGVELVCLAGFMRILTGEFVRKWQGKLINVHPSLLPSFKGMHAHRQALQAGVRLSGCTVHFVEEEVDAGGIIVQESVPVYPNDTEETLQERVKTAEHKAYPHAMELIASNRVSVTPDGKVKWNLD